MSDTPAPGQIESQAVSLPIWNEVFAGAEYLTLHLSPVYYGVGTPHGDGAGVILVPGFLGTDNYLWELYLWLRRIGYQPYMSGIGRNADCFDVLVTKLQQTVEEAYTSTGRPVHLIGHSLGGLLARAVTEEKPEWVASVITLGSPFRGISSHRIVHEASEAVRKRLQSNGKGPVRPRCFTGSCTCAAIAALKRSLAYSSVMQTAIYSQYDGIVDWQNCINDDPATNFAVISTHIGLVFNPCVYETISTRLAEATRIRAKTYAAQTR